MKILNLYAGIGGNRKLWGDEHEVTAVENNKEIAKIYMKFYPKDAIVIGDAHQYLLDHFDQFDFIWSSPPCQTHSKMNKATKHEIRRYPEMNLYQEIIFLEHFFEGKWVVENVDPYYEPLVENKKIGRHIFWSNFNIGSFNKKSPNNFSKAKREEIVKWLGIDYPGNIYLNGNHDPTQLLRNCVHPEVGKHIFRMAFKEKQEVLDA